MHDIKKNKVIIGVLIIFIGLLLIHDTIDLKEKLNDVTTTIMKPLALITSFSYEDDNSLQNFDAEKQIQESVTKVYNFQYSQIKYFTKLPAGIIAILLGLSVILFSDDEKYFWEKVFCFFKKY